MANFTAGAVLTASALNTAFNTATINAQTTGYTIGTADAGELVTVNNNSGGTVTIPANSTWGAATGTIVSILNAGTAGSWTIGTAAGVTLNASSTTLAALESGRLVKTATNTWYFTKGGGLGKASVTATTGSPTVTTVSGKTCYQFTGSGTITIGNAGLCEVLIVGGGGGGGSSTGAGGGGGGAGGYLATNAAYAPSGVLTVTVGAGGSGASQAGSNGNASRMDSYFVTGGGKGALYQAGLIFDGGIGGSGGGGSSYTAGGNGGAGTAGLGNAGGAGSASSAGGGGGGANAVGSAASGTTGGAGGSGIASSITGSSVTRGGGGGGGGATGGAGGSGGGGAGAAGAGNNGTVNTGGGGGGSGTTAGNGGTGGSGTVIILIG